MKKDLAKTYDPKEVEDRIYNFWLKGEYFSAKTDENKTPYTIVIPPPNITGKLHIGHALDETLQDIIIRHKRMSGYSALWVPGTDHASIATEAKIEEAMRKEGLSKEKLGREEFLKRAWIWKEKYGKSIIDQLKKLGASCDWHRTRFTLDEGCSAAVREVFVKLFEKGLIYRGERIINWCPNCKTSISDAEVAFYEKEGKFWHIRYKIANDNGFIELATTRPETLLGDTAVAVHPEDERYQNLIGKSVILPLIGRKIPIIADSYVEKDFGTGVVKITPAHDPHDFEIGLRHNLPIINIIDEKAKINENGGKYANLTLPAARDAVVNDLKKEGHLIKIEPIVHNVGSCYRCKTVIEPRISKQWFVKMKPLAEPAIEYVKAGKIKFVPERFEKIYYHWMENIKDWCISRQLWWGHRIPAFHCRDCGKITVTRDKTTICSHCKSLNIKQDEDTLDTWFSSALWPFSSLGWPEKTRDLSYFYPTHTLVTGYDIIFFWVARMIFSAIEHTNNVPFKTVFIHGLIRDEQGRKMSKSLGNGIDPLEIIESYGADALRMALATNVGPGNDIRFSYDKVLANRNFANKIWNAARFIRINIENEIIEEDLPTNLMLEDKWIINLFNTLVKEVTENLEKFELGLAIAKLYDFTWDKFCDWYIEFAKIRLNNGTSAKEAKCTLVWVMKNILKLLHPFMPFITEEIYTSLPHKEEALTISRYPEFSKELFYEKDQEKIEKIIEIIRAIRNRRAELNVAPSKKTKIYIATDFTNDFKGCEAFFTKLAYGTEIFIDKDFNIPETLTIISTNAKVYIPLGELVDRQAERQRLQKQLEKCEAQLMQAENKLENDEFLAKAPKHVIEKISNNKNSLCLQISRLKSEIDSFL